MIACKNVSKGLKMDDDAIAAADVYRAFFAKPSLGERGNSW